MSRPRALELLELADLVVDWLPRADTELTWHTRVADIGIEVDALLSAMAELRDERWVTGSVTPVVSGASTTRIACVFRRLSTGEDQALRMQSQAMIVPQPNLGRRG